MPSCPSFTRPVTAVTAVHSGPCTLNRDSTPFFTHTHPGAPLYLQHHEFYKNFFGKAPKAHLPTTHVLGAAPPPLREPSDAEVAAAPVDPATWHGRFNVSGRLSTCIFVECI